MKTKRMEYILNYPSSFGIESTPFGSQLGVYRPSYDLIKDLEEASILVIGAGGLGCEILKSLCMSHFQHISILDMDTVSLSNLNRQFLYQREDIGKYKCIVAKYKLEKRFPHVQIQSYPYSLEHFSSSFYKQFDLILSGLDTVESRLHLNSVLYSLLEYNENGDLDPLSIHPFLDGGTEGLLGNYRLVIPGYTSCIQCSLDLFTKEEDSIPLCTVAGIPRLPEHCVLYAQLIAFPDTYLNTPFDLKNEEHFSFVLQKAQERAQEYHIEGVTHSFVSNVLKRVIPSVSSTNSVIANMMVLEAVKLLTGSGQVLENYLLLNQQEECSALSMRIESRSTCPICNIHYNVLTVDFGITLEELISILETINYIFKEIPTLHHIRLFYKDQILYTPNLPEYFSENLRKPLNTLIQNNTRIRIETDETDKIKGSFYLKLKNKI